MRKIAVFGKGGIGKSTLTSNLAAAYAARGLRVLLVGCDPKHDTTVALTEGDPIRTAVEHSAFMDNSGGEAAGLVVRGRLGVDCVEAGGPEPGIGCAGRGIGRMITMLEGAGVLDDGRYDVAIFDVLGDVVCGGFAVPVREGIAEHVFTVSSADFMAIYAANNLFRGIEKFSNSGGALLGGIIANSINTDFQREIIEDFAERTSTPIVQYVPRSMTVTQAELSGKTTIEAAPESAQADVYRALARTIAGHEVSRTPTPLSPTELREWSARWAEHIVRLEKAERSGRAREREVA